VELRRIKKYEFKIYGGFDKCLVFSHSEAQVIKNNCPDEEARVQLPIIDSGLDDARYAHVKEEKDVLLFFGALKTIPNEDAVRYFYDEIFPLVRKQAPMIKLRIIGKHPSRRLRKIILDPSVELINFAEDLNTELKKAALAVVPIRIGGGIRIKILTAWAGGKAVVSTSEGAGGLPYKDGIDIAIADTPQIFSEKIIWLLRNPQLRRQMGEAGRKNVRQNFNPAKIISELANCYKEAIEHK
jgi:glycosyltransferase involved in cell wall biosynthesis